MSSRATTGWRAAVLLVLMLPAHALGAGYEDAVGYSALKAELGKQLPTGKGVLVMQVEGTDHGPGESPGWAPDASAAGLSGKHFLLPSLSSEHATVVGLLFYGSGSMAPGIADVECYPSELWASDPAGFLRPGTDLLPMVSPTVVANHSYVGSREGPEGQSVEILKRLDYLVATDDFVQVVGVNNAREVRELWQCTYNALVVSSPSRRHATGTLPLDAELYGAGRAKPEIVAPMPSSSEATPLVASAAAMLIGFAHAQGLAVSKGSYVSPRSGRLVYYAETSEVIKAALLAGADRPHRMERRPARRQTGGAGRSGPQNGMDPRLGAGTLNVRNSYHILAAGQQGTGQGAPARDERRLGPLGFDYNPAFGGAAGTAREARYRLAAPAGTSGLKAVLVWNLKVNEDAKRWDGQAELYDMDLKLYDLDRSDAVPIAQSDSWVDNVETIRAAVTPGHAYELRVVAAERQPDFLWDFALAWQMEQSERRRADSGWKARGRGPFPTYAYVWR